MRERRATRSRPAKHAELTPYERARALILLSDLVAADRATLHLSYFMRPLHHVAAETGIGPTTLKKACRAMGLAKWPSR